MQSKRTADASEHIHVAYYCVRAGDHRLEPAEVDFIRGLHDLGIPVFLVLTQVHQLNGAYRPEHMQFAQYLYEQGLPIYLGRRSSPRRCPTPPLATPRTACPSWWTPPSRQRRRPPGWPWPPPR